MVKSVNWVQSYVPTPKQQLLHSVKVKQILFGGAAGGGKTKGIIEDMLTWAIEVPGIQIYVFRKVLNDLEKTIMLDLKHMEIPPEIAKMKAGEYKMDFYNGSNIYFCHCEADKDVEKYLGVEMHILYIDEAVLMTPFQLQNLEGRLRLGKFRQKIIDNDKARAKQGKPPLINFLPRTVYTTNPIGGPSRSYLKKRFVDPTKPYTRFNDKFTSFKRKDGTINPGKVSIFIPSTVNDNPHVEEEYLGQFTQMTPERARALRDGDWDVIEGGAIPGLSRAKHEIPKFDIPRHWTVFMAMDWGTAKPFSVGWYAVSDGCIIEDNRGGREREIIIPEGAIIRFFEWYGWNGTDDVGIRWGSDEVARRIIEIEKEQNMPPVTYRVADYQMWAQTDGPSPKERMYTASGGRVNLVQSKKDRRANYHEFLARVNGTQRKTDPTTGEPLPMLFITEDCLQFWRTLPNLTLDENDPDKGPNTRQEDHIYDEVCYAITSRPSVTTKKDVELRHFNQMRRKVETRPYY